MILRSTVIAFAVACSMFAEPVFAQAGTYEQAPAHFGGFGSDASITVADQFRFAETTNVAQIAWWGGYAGPSAPEQDAFAIRIYADAGGQPGPVLHTYSVGHSPTRTSTGDFVNPPGPGFPGAPEYYYSFEPPSPFQAAGGVTYWISIINTPSSEVWLWEVSSGTASPGVQRSFGGPEGPWQPFFDDTAFRLSDVVLPPPPPAPTCSPVTALQPPARFGGIVSDGQPYTIADDFVLTEAWTGGSVVWWGGYATAEPGQDAFEIRLYSDEWGRPGAVLASFMPPTVVRTATGCSFTAPTVPGHPEYRYAAALPPGLQLEAGLRYWLSIRNQPQAGWTWESTSQPQAPGLQRSFFGISWEWFFDGTAFDFSSESGQPPTCSFAGTGQPPAEFSGTRSNVNEFVAADDFVLPRAANVSRIDWWGGTTMSAWTPAADLVVQIYDDGGGQPGTLLRSYGPGLAIGREATGRTLSPVWDPAFGDPEYRYTFYLPEPLEVEAHTSYWVSVANAAPGGTWTWTHAASTARAGYLVRYAPGQGPWHPDWQSARPGLAFDVFVAGTSCVTDADGDGREDDEDSDPANPAVCADTDLDGCDDCSAGHFSLENDGPDADFDGTCDVTDEDDDHDGVLDGQDNCPLVPNPGQQDLDGDGVGSVCDGPHAQTCAGADQPSSHSSALGSIDENNTAADDFVVERDAFITRLVWWGGFGNPPPQGAPPERFTVRIHEDAGGLPGAVIHTFTPSVVSREETGDPLFAMIPPSASPREYRYAFALPDPLPLSAGRYWLAIGAAFESAIWSWSVSPVREGAIPASSFWFGDQLRWTTVQDVNGLAFTVVLSGGACTDDTDGDGVFDGEDDPDADRDRVPDTTDNCPSIPNPDQEDVDQDGIGSVCDGTQAETCVAGAEQVPSRLNVLGSDGINWTVADNFRVERQAFLQRLVWWGGFEGEEQDALVEWFTIRLYDDANGRPGPLRHTFRPRARVVKERTGEPLFGRIEPLPPPEYRYTLDLPAPVALPAGTYWVGIGAFGTPQVWLWSGSQEPGLAGVFNSAGGNPEHGPWMPASSSMENVAFSIVVAGAACATDGDADGVFDGEDNCPALANPAQADFDHDGSGDDCDPDDDGDAVDDSVDNCLELANPGQEDFDRDHVGDACDPDDDGDSVADSADLCAWSVIPETSVPTVALGDGRYALVNGDAVFDTTGILGITFTTVQTHGCTCAQMLAVSSGEKEGHYKHGCSADLVQAFIAGHP